MLKRIKIKNKFLILSASLFSLLCISCGEYYKVKVGFAGYLTAEKVEVPLYYGDDYFNEPSTKYNEHLAASSALLAMSGFSSTIGNDYANSPRNAEEFFRVTGFSNFSSNEYGITIPTLHSFGVYCASKKIEDYTLIAVTTRGAGYLAEWGSNFLLGKDGQFATGFGEASDIYISFLKDYISKQNIKGNVKIWTAGYSRGGVGTNISIGRIDEAIDNNEAILGEGVNLKKEDIYCYCFETPAGRIASFNADNSIKEKGSDFSNIHCVVNLNDMVTMVGPSSFKFVRYGKDYYLPDLITDLNYSRYIKKVKEILANLPNAKIVGDYLIDTFNFSQVFNKGQKHNWTMGSFLKTFVNEFCVALGSREKYAEVFEQAFANIFYLIYKNGTPKDSLIDLGINVGKSILLNDTNEIILIDLQHNRSRLWQDLKPCLQSALEKARLEGVTVSEMMDLLKTVVDIVFKIADSEEGLACVPSLFNFKNFHAFASAHYPELLLSHIMALDSNYVGYAYSNLKDSFFTIEVDKTSDFTLKNNGKVIARYENEILDTMMVADEKLDKIVFFVPEAEGYVIESKEKVNFDIYLNSGEFLEEKKISEEDEIKFVGGNSL